MIFRDKKWVYGAMILALGFFLGTSFGEWKAHERFHCRWGKGDMKTFILERLNKKLELSAEQKAQVGAILDRKHPEMLALQSEFQPRFKALRRTTQQEIRALLTPNQQKKFDEFNAKWESRHAARFPELARAEAGKVKT